MVKINHSDVFLEAVPRMKNNGLESIFPWIFGCSYPLFTSFLKRSKSGRSGSIVGQCTNGQKNTRSRVSERAKKYPLNGSGYDKLL
jgi:hypothetical protein